jgi:uncharacterized membrane protein
MPFGKAIAWLFFLFAEYCALCTAVFPICCHWTPYQLLGIAPGVLVAYWVRRPGENWAQKGIGARLIVGGALLIGATFLFIVTYEISYDLRQNGR